MSSNLGGKAGLLGEIEQEWEQFLEAARGLSEEDLTRASAVGHWSARDVMVHTAAVNEVLIKELTVFLAEGKEADYGDEDAVVQMNDVQLEEKQALSLSEVWELLDRSYREAFSYLQSLPEEAYGPGRLRAQACDGGDGGALPGPQGRPGAGTNRRCFCFLGLVCSQSWRCGTFAG